MIARLTRLAVRRPSSPGVLLGRQPAPCRPWSRPVHLAVPGEHAAATHGIPAPADHQGKGEGRGGRGPPWSAAALVPGAVAAVTVAAWSSVCSDTRPACAPLGEVAPSDDTTGAGTGTTGAAGPTEWPEIFQGFLDQALRKSRAGGGAGQRGSCAAEADPSAEARELNALIEETAALHETGGSGRTGGGSGRRAGAGGTGSAMEDDAGGVVGDGDDRDWQVLGASPSRRTAREPGVHGLIYFELWSAPRGCWYAPPKPYRLTTGEAGKTIDEVFSTRDEALAAQAWFYGSSRAVTE